MNTRESRESNDLFRAGKINAHRAPFLDTRPARLTTQRLPEKLAGMMLGLTIGDQMGAPSEGILPLRRRHVGGFTSGHHPTDDTQLSFWMLEQMVKDRGLVPHRIMQLYHERYGRTRGKGSTYKRAMSRYGATYKRAASYYGGAGTIPYSGGELDWRDCGQQSAGNGALMRIAPVVYPHLSDPTCNLWADAVLATMMTHNDEAAIASSVAFVNMLWQLLDWDGPPHSSWWLSEFVHVAQQFGPIGMYSPRGGDYEGVEMPFADYVAMVVRDASEADLDTIDACDGWYSGAYLLETVPSVLYILQKHAHNPREALLRAVNDTKDNDTSAAIVGAALGALYGANAWPAPWVTAIQQEWLDIIYDANELFVEHKSVGYNEFVIG